MTMRQTPSASCPPPERIEAVRTGEGTAADAAHIEGCAECRELVRELERLAETLRAGRSQPEPPPAEVEMSIFEAYRETMEAKKSPATIVRPSWKRWAMPLAAAATVAMFAVMVQLESPTQYKEVELREESVARPALQPVVTAEADRVGKTDQSNGSGRLGMNQPAKPDAVAVAEPEARQEARPETKAVAKAKKVAPAPGASPAPATAQSADWDEGVAYRAAKTPAAPVKRERANLVGQDEELATKSFADDFAPRELAEAEAVASPATQLPVNVLDVLRLALAVEQGQADPSLDRNADGRVDQTDVEFLARLAVRLDEG